VTFYEIINLDGFVKSPSAALRCNFVFAAHLLTSPSIPWISRVRPSTCLAIAGNSRAVSAAAGNEPGDDFEQSRLSDPAGAPNGIGTLQHQAQVDSRKMGLWPKEKERF
jgi:hypothetical protein